VIPNRLFRISPLSDVNDQIRGFDKKKIFSMIDSDSGTVSIYSLTIAFSEPHLGTRACFLHDCHHSFGRSKSSCPRVCSLNFQAFSFALHLLMEVFAFVFYHPLEPVDPCFEDSREGFLSNFVENVGDRAF
jgi:hypothetical protein